MVILSKYEKRSYFALKLHHLKEERPSTTCKNKIPLVQVKHGLKYFWLHKFPKNIYAAKQLDVHKKTKKQNIQNKNSEHSCDVSTDFVGEFPNVPTVSPLDDLLSLICPLLRSGGV